MIVYVGLDPGSQRMHYQFLLCHQNYSWFDGSFPGFPRFLVSLHGILQNGFTLTGVTSGSSKMTKWPGCCNKPNVEEKVLSVVLGVTWLPFLAGIRASSRLWPATPLCQFLPLHQLLTPIHAVEQRCLSDP
jgi:hypothetical protein